MKKRTVYITETDQTRLLRMLEDMRFADPKRAKDLAALETEIQNAQTVSPNDVPPNLVTMNSRVRLLDLDTGEKVSYTVVFPDEADVSASKISVLAPVGTALLGYREGYEFSWNVPDGVRRLKIEKLEYQPEAAGDPAL